MLGIEAANNLNINDNTHKLKVIYLMQEFPY